MRDPLAQFQNTNAQKEDVRKLIHTVNNARGVEKLPESEINETFDVWWPMLEKRLDSIPEYQQPQQPRRSEREILEEILEVVRAQSRASRNAELASTLEQAEYLLLAQLHKDDAQRIADYLGEPLIMLISYHENPSLDC